MVTDVASAGAAAQPKARANPNVSVANRFRVVISPFRIAKSADQSEACGQSLMFRNDAAGITIFIPSLRDALLRGAAQESQITTGL